MLFNSFPFIFGFLPLSLLVFHGLRRAGFERSSIFALTLLSLLFYGWWNPVYLLLLVPLMLVNYAIAVQIAPHGNQRSGFEKPLLIVGLVTNVAVLGYFKYANFFVDNLNTLFGLDVFLAHVVLPLGISFFIFQKIAFLVDAYRGKLDRLDLLDYSLFVTFFPQLIAGPIVHHSEVLPQFRRSGGVSSRSITMGVTIFAIGLAKKVLLADTAAVFATPLFASVATGARLDLLSAWTGALSYTAQLYFDFSGYSDMAIGAALLFGIWLPVNFASPYKATSIIDFWRRWHITLSRFLRDYLYVPLGGNRLGNTRRYVNLFTTMLLGGLWHGAGWTFVIWGGLHGFYLTVNHGWRVLRSRLGSPFSQANPIGAFIGGVVTFLAVVVGWVFFRAANFSAAVNMLKAMLGFYGISMPISLAHIVHGTSPDSGSVDNGLGLIVACFLLLITWLAPNTQELTGYVGPDGAYGCGEMPSTTPAIYWQPSLRWGLALGILLAFGIMSLSHISEFLYFQF
jgi:alginate O-acetyltransferase complex protein AlgI